MRLLCPNCDAQYEVPDEVIPTEGRDVQCSNCGKTWFQHHPDFPPAAAEDAGAPPDVDAPVDGEERASAPPPPPSADAEPTEETIYDEVAAPSRRGVSPDVADILREEAEQEARARAEERAALESQPDLGLEEGGEGEADRRARQARERMARMRGEPEETGKDASRAAASAAAAAAGSRRDLLPDIDEINSTLRSNTDRPGRAENKAASEASKPRKKGGRGFRLGFALSLLIAAGAFYVYMNAAQIAQQVPQADPYISAFVAQVDTGRAWLDGQVRQLTAWINSLTNA